MNSLKPRHLVLVRHGESEGDVRRKQGVQALKHPKDEGQTETGHKQSQAVGIWIAKHVLEVYGFERFDSYLTSPLVRTKQSAQSLGLSDKWVEEPKLVERNRGDIQGMIKHRHKENYPDSYKAMQDHPFHWVPPGGESILAVSHRIANLVDELSDVNTVLMMTHRDVMWAAHVPLDKLTFDEVERLNTDYIGNGQVFHYTNVNPSTGVVEEPDLIWKRSVNPPAITTATQDSGWVNLDRA